MPEKSNLFGSTLRGMRLKQNVLIRQVAAALEVDTAFISKVERGSKRIARDQVRKIADFLAIPEQKLLQFWLADKIEDAIEGEDEAAGALKLVLKLHKQKHD